MLSGIVRSWNWKDEADRAAWTEPGCRWSTIESPSFRDSRPPLRAEGTNAGMCPHAGVSSVLAPYMLVRLQSVRCAVLEQVVFCEEVPMAIRSSCGPVLQHYVTRVTDPEGAVAAVLAQSTKRERGRAG